MRAYCYMKRKTPTTSLPPQLRRKITETANMLPLEPTFDKAHMADISMDTNDGFQAGETCFLNMTPEQRQEVYKDKFSNQVEPLSHIALPDECATYPQFEGEILAAYFRYTTFMVKVWVNYDTATEKFYIDPRANDCGKVIMKPKEKAQFERLIQNYGGFELSRIRLEIGTPFTDLCDMTLRAVPSKLNVGYNTIAKLTAWHEEHPEVTEFVQDIFAEFDGGELLYEQKGFRMENIEYLASLCNREPTQAEFTHKQRYPNDGVWMDIDGREVNRGWVDFHKLGKGCSKCRGGCRYDHVMCA